MKIEITVENEVEGQMAWTASAFQVEDDGKSSEALATGTGLTPKLAIWDLLADWWL